MKLISYTYNKVYQATEPKTVFKIAEPERAYSYNPVIESALFNMFNKPVGLQREAYPVITQWGHALVMPELEKPSDALKYSPEFSAMMAEALHFLHHEFSDNVDFIKQHMKQLKPIEVVEQKMLERIKPYDTKVVTHVLELWKQTRAVLNLIPQSELVNPKDYNTIVHTDPHHNNWMLNSDRTEVILIDWESACLAVPERDYAVLEAHTILYGTESLLEDFGAYDELNRHELTFHTLLKVFQDCTYLLHRYGLDAYYDAAEKCSAYIQELSEEYGRAL